MKRAGITNPTRCKHEHEVSTAIKRWEERYRILKEDDRELELPDSWKMTALQFSAEKSKRTSSTERDFKTYNELRSVVMKWAINKNIGNERAGFDPMDLNLARGYQQKAWWKAG